jgi:hypothetical protein
MKLMFRLVKMQPKLFFALISLTLCGCSPHEISNQNLTGFLVNKIRIYGGYIQNSNTLPKIETRWRFNSDANGFHVITRGNSFDQVDVLFQTLYGPPLITMQKNSDGFPQRTYSASKAGLAITYRQIESGVDIVCLKKMDDWK